MPHVVVTSLAAATHATRLPVESEKSRSSSPVRQQLRTDILLRKTPLISRTFAGMHWSPASQLTLAPETRTHATVRVRLEGLRRFSIASLNFTRRLLEHPFENLFIIFYTFSSSCFSLMPIRRGSWGSSRGFVTDARRESLETESLSREAKGLTRQSRCPGQSRGWVARPPVRWVGSRRRRRSVGGR